MLTHILMCVCQHAPCVPKRSEWCVLEQTALHQLRVLNLDYDQPNRMWGEGDECEAFHVQRRLRYVCCAARDERRRRGAYPLPA